jgi:hypothetical protein
MADSFLKIKNHAFFDKIYIVLVIFFKNSASSPASCNINDEKIIFLLLLLGSILCLPVFQPKNGWNKLLPLTIVKLLLLLLPKMLNLKRWNDINIEFLPA